MGCTHSKNSKSKSARTNNEQPLERSLHNGVPHFDETKHTTPSTSQESEDKPVQYSKNLLNETGAESMNQRHDVPVEPEKGVKTQETKSRATVAIQTNEQLPMHTKVMKNQPTDVPPDKRESTPHTAIPPATHQKQYVASTYYPMPTVGEKQKSPEKKKLKKKSEAPVAEQVAEKQEEKKKKKDYGRDKSTVLGPNFRPQLTPEDLECIRRSVQQRNERRAYMMAHRNETDDTLYELEVRMPEKDYTNRIETVQNSRAY